MEELSSIVVEYLRPIEPAGSTPQKPYKHDMKQLLVMLRCGYKFLFPVTPLLQLPVLRKPASPLTADDAYHGSYLSDEERAVRESGAGRGLDSDRDVNEDVRQQLVCQDSLDSNQVPEHNNLQTGEILQLSMCLKTSALSKLLDD